MAFLYYEDFFEVLEETYQDIYDGKYCRLNRNVIQTGKGGKKYVKSRVDGKVRERNILNIECMKESESGESDTIGRESIIKRSLEGKGKNEGEL